MHQELTRLATAIIFILLIATPCQTNALNKPIFIAIAEKIGTLTHLNTLIFSHSLGQNPVTTPAASFENREIIDAYSGIKITTDIKSVYFSYLNETSGKSQKIIDADPLTFDLLETGTEILATDKNALYLITGYNQKRFPEIDISNVSILRDHNNSQKYLQTADGLYLISKTGLIPVQR